MSVRKNVRPDGSAAPKPWQARVKLPGGGERARSFASRREAVRWETGQRAALNRGDWTDPRSAKVLFADIADMWLSGKVDCKPGTINAYRGLLQSRVLPKWGDISVGVITHGAIRRWVAELSTEVSPARVRSSLLVLGAVLDLAVADGRLARNVARGVPLPRQAQRDGHRYLRHEDVAALAAAAGEHGTVVQVLSYCGLRFGELAALSCGDVDGLRGRLHVRRTASEVNGRLVVGSPKGGRARVVDAPGFLVHALVELAAGRDPAEPLFLAPGGGRLRLSNWRARVWQPATAAIGQHELKVHDLRHTCASLAISAGASALAVSNLLGHSSPAITLGIYSHLLESDARAVADRLDEARRMSDGRTSVTPLRHAR